MRVCDQFTDARIARFFPPINHELEVHSSVDLSGTPSVVGLGLELPVVVIGSDDKDPRGANPLTLTDGVGLAQGEKVVGLQAYRAVNSDAKHAPRFINDEDMNVFGSDYGVAPESLDGLTHTIVELDWTIGPGRVSHRKIKDSPFGENGTAVLPVEEPIPHIDDAFENWGAFVVKGFVNKNGEMVKWSTVRSGTQWLVDLCVMHAYVHNRVELSLLKNAIGHEATLLGLVSVNEDVAAYLKAFDETVLGGRSGVTFTPSSEPTFNDYARKFPGLDRKEGVKLGKLTEVSHKAMTTPNRSQLV